jgi:hypothetical protein
VSTYIRSAQVKVFYKTSTSALQVLIIDILIILIPVLTYATRNYLICDVTILSRIK